MHVDWDIALYKWTFTFSSFSFSSNSFLLFFLLFVVRWFKYYLVLFIFLLSSSSCRLLSPSIINDFVEGVSQWWGRAQYDVWEILQTSWQSTIHQWKAYKSKWIPLWQIQKQFMDKDEEQMNKQKSSLDYERYFLKQWILGQNLKDSNRLSLKRREQWISNGGFSCLMCGKKSRVTQAGFRDLGGKVSVAQTANGNTGKRSCNDATLN